jgi:hypothetical protein
MMLKPLKCAALGLAAFGLLVGGGARVNAGITGVTNGSVLYSDANVDFRAEDGSLIVNGQGQGISKSLTGLSPLVNTVTYGAPYDFGPGNFRLSEQIVNNTGSALSGLTITLGGTNATFASFFNDNFSPGVVTIDTGTSPIQVQFVQEYSDGGITLSNGDRTVTFAFNAPVAPGATFGVHIPIMNLDAGGGTFTLPETAVVPEPGTLGSAAVAVLAALFYRRRRRQASAAPRA